MIRMLHRLVCMEPSRLTKRIFLWDSSLTESTQLPTWGKEVKDILTRNDLQQVFRDNIFDLKSTIQNLKSSLLLKDQQKLKNSCIMPKLRTYNLIAEFNSPKAYLMKPLSFLQRKSVAKLRLGVLPIRLETGRYERPILPPELRICQQCNLGVAEDEIHFTLECPRYTILREKLLSYANESFQTLKSTEKLKYLLNM